jgi:hypothetical protein
VVTTCKRVSVSYLANSRLTQINSIHDRFAVCSHFARKVGPIPANSVGFSSERKDQVSSGYGTHGEFDVKEAAFPAGATLEYRVEIGDRYFDGDHGLSLARTLWVIEPDGSKSLLASGFVLYMSLKVAARNLEEHGISLRAVSFYKGKDGRIVENEISISHSEARFTTALFLGFFNLWLGIIAALFVHKVGYLVAIGTAAFIVLAVARVHSATSRRTAFLKIISILPSYAAGYSVAVVFVRFVARR